MLGFYSWQLLGNQRQNDAILYGLGASFTANSLQVESSLSGYRGYFPIIKDAPVVFRSQALYPLKSWNLGIGYEIGLHDYPFQKLQLILQYHISPKKKALFPILLTQQ